MQQTPTIPCSEMAWYLEMRFLFFSLNFCTTGHFHRLFYSVSSYVVYEVRGTRREELGEYVVGDFDLSRCPRQSGRDTEYPVLRERMPYMHSFALTQNYIILPLGSYLLDYCGALCVYIFHFLTAMEPENF